MHLAAEVGLFKTVAIHHVDQVFKFRVEHLMKFFPDRREGLLGW